MHGLPKRVVLLGEVTDDFIENRLTKMVKMMREFGAWDVYGVLGADSARVHMGVVHAIIEGVHERAKKGSKNTIPQKGVEDY